MKVIIIMGILIIISIGIFSFYILGREKKSKLFFVVIMWLAVAISIPIFHKFWNRVVKYLGLDSVFDLAVMWGAVLLGFFLIELILDSKKNKDETAVLSQEFALLSHSIGREKGADSKVAEIFGEIKNMNDEIISILDNSKRIIKGTNWGGEKNVEVIVFQWRCIIEDISKSLGWINYIIGKLTKTIVQDKREKIIEYLIEKGADLYDIIPPVLEDMKYHIRLIKEGRIDELDRSRIDSFIKKECYISMWLGRIEYYIEENDVVMKKIEWIDMDAMLEEFEEKWNSTRIF